jgi:hypothetical protein
MRGPGCSPLSVIIVHDQAGVNNSWDPAKQRQNYAEKETGNTTGHEHSQWRKNHAEKISQRFHHELFLFRFVLLFGRWTPARDLSELDVFLLFPRSVFCSS